jgi:hypothetical protein
MPDGVVTVAKDDSFRERGGSVEGDKLLETNDQGHKLGSVIGAKAGGEASIYLDIPFRVKKRGARATWPRVRSGRTIGVAEDSTQGSGVDNGVVSHGGVDNSSRAGFNSALVT